MHVANGTLELKEKISLIVMFHGLFLSKGLHVKDIRKLFHAMTKRGKLIKRLFSNDNVAGAHLICVLDNRYNLFLEQCESSVDTSEISQSYFSCNDIIVQA